MQEFKNIYGSATTNLIISKKEMNDIIKIVEALGDFNILLKGVTKTIKNKTNEQKGEFLSMLLGSLRASLLRNMLVGKGIVRAGSGNRWLWKKFSKLYELLVIFFYENSFDFLKSIVIKKCATRYYQQKFFFKVSFFNAFFFMLFTNLLTHEVTLNSFCRELNLLVLITHSIDTPESTFFSK